MAVPVKKFITTTTPPRPLIDSSSNSEIFAIALSASFPPASVAMERFAHPMYPARPVVLATPVLVQHPPHLNGLQPGSAHLLAQPVPWAELPMRSAHSLSHAISGPEQRARTCSREAQGPASRHLPFKKQYSHQECEVASLLVSLGNGGFSYEDAAPAALAW